MSNVTKELWTSFKNAPFPRLLGFSLLELSENYAKVSVKVRPDHANFLGFADGALITSLADYAAACACNSSGETRVGVHCSINIIASTAIGNELVAEAKSTNTEGDMCVTEAIVTDSDGRTVARATNTSIASRKRKQD